MIRDAYNGLLPGMSRDSCFDAPPTDPKIWELNRLATLPGIKVAQDLPDAANRFLIQQQAESCFFLGPPDFLRMAKSLGYSPKRLGPTVRNDDGAFLAFICDVVDFREYSQIEYADLGTLR